MPQTFIIPNKIGNYYFRGTIGEGAFAVVKLVFNENSQQYFACKIIQKTRILEKQLGVKFESEIRINQQLHHPGIVSLIDILQDSLNFYIIMEFCPNGELFHYIVDRGRLNEKEAKVLVLQIIRAIKYVHLMGVTHRDLKPENILLDQFGRIKISDFGLSRFLPINSIVSTPCGSPCYASPECLAGKPYDGKASDMWSIGVIVYAIMTGQLPWTKRNQKELFIQIQSADYNIPLYLSEEARSFIRSLLTLNPKERLTPENALIHCWLQGTVSNCEGYESTTKIVSLKTVDLFFNRDQDFGEFKTAKIQKNLSQVIDFQLISHSIQCADQENRPPANQNQINLYENTKSQKKFEIKPKPNAKQAALSVKKTIAAQKSDIPYPILTIPTLESSRKSGKFSHLLKQPKFPVAVQRFG